MWTLCTGPIAPYGALSPHIENGDWREGKLPTTSSSLPLLWRVRVGEGLGSPLSSSPAPTSLAPWAGAKAKPLSPGGRREKAFWGNWSPHPPLSVAKRPSAWSYAAPNAGWSFWYLFSNLNIHAILLVNYFCSLIN